MRKLDLTQLKPNSTIAELKTYSFQVNLDSLGQVINEKFQNNPELPGVIVKDGSNVVGMISQKKFFERMSQPYSLELYLNRPIKVILNVVKTEYLQLPITCQIEQAFSIALNRDANQVYEPIVVVEPNQKLSLLDMHLLLRAQSQISAVLQLENLNRRQALERQQIQLQKQAQEIHTLNQQFMNISQLLSVEGKATFIATFTGVNSICRVNSKIVSIGKALEKDIEKMNHITHLIESVSKQTRNLIAQTDKTVSKSGKEIIGTSYISSEVIGLSAQIIKATSELNQIANGFKFWIQELTEATQDGETTASSLLHKNQDAQAIFKQLEKLVMLQKLSEVTKAALSSCVKNIHDSTIPN